MTDIYIVLVEDRHIDVDALPYTTQEVAIARAEKLLAQFARYPEDVERDLNAAMVDDGWVWYARYSEEGDSISVIRRELNGSR
jgi:hypothetical protein